MSWGTPPVFTTGQVAASTDLNTISGDLAVLANRVGLYSVGSAMVGSPPGNTQPNFFLIAGVAGVTLNGSSQGTLVWPAGFPNGLQTVVMTPIDSGGNNFGIAQLVGGGANTAGAGFTGYAILAGGSPSVVGMGAGNVLVAYFVVGF